MKSLDAIKESAGSTEIELIGFKKVLKTCTHDTVHACKEIVVIVVFFHCVVTICLFDTVLIIKDWPTDLSQ